MPYRFFRFLCFFILYAVFISSAAADIIILKDGQVIKDVSIRDEGDSLYCESETQTFYIHKRFVENIIKTGPATLPEKIRDFIKFLPQKTRLFVKDYFTFAMTIAGLLILLAALVVCKFLWVNMSPVFRDGAKRRDIIRSVRELDAEEQSVLREFYLQQAGTLEMPVEDRVVSGLIKKGILETTRDKGQYSAGGLMLPVIVTPPAKKHIKPRNIGLPKDLNDPSVREALAKSRPQYMYDMAGFYKSLEKKGADKY